MKHFVHYPAEISLNEQSHRPDHMNVISKDEIVNLKIALEINEDVLDFLDDEYLFD